MGQDQGQKGPGQAGHQGRGPTIKRPGPMQRYYSSRLKSKEDQEIHQGHFKSGHESPRMVVLVRYGEITLKDSWDQE